jgi:hypothetical protein
MEREREIDRERARYIEREREKERERHTHTHTQRERARERERERERKKERKRERETDRKRKRKVVAKNQTKRGRAGTCKRTCTRMHTTISFVGGFPIYLDLGCPARLMVTGLPLKSRLVRGTVAARWRQSRQWWLHSFSGVELKPLLRNLRPSANPLTNAARSSL